MYTKEEREGILWEFHRSGLSIRRACGTLRLFPSRHNLGLWLRLEEAGELGMHFERVIEERRGGERFEAREAHPYYVVVCASEQLADKASAVQAIVDARENPGMSLITVARQMKDLPKECRSVIGFEGTGAYLLDRDDSAGERKAFMPDMDRSVIYDRINRRVDIMMQQGLEQEARSLYENGKAKGTTCFQAIGYKEFEEYFSGEEDLEQTAYKIKLGSRHYAKRQLTWFRQMGEDIRPVPSDDIKKAAGYILSSCKMS